MTFNVFKNLRLIDLSSNKLAEFPVCLRDCPKLRIVRLIGNKIESIPDEYLQTDQVSSCLEELILNNNPLKLLNASLGRVRSLKVLGVSYTNVQAVPQGIASLPKLEQLNCYGSKLTEPPQDVADKGLEAIREYFNLNGHGGGTAGQTEPAAN